MNSSDTRPVVVGVDGAPGSAGALRYAVAEAGRRSVPLHLVHTSPSLVTMGLPFGPSGGTMLPLPAAELERVGTAVLDEAATTVHRIAAEVEIVTRLVPGPAATALVEYSAHAQLVVIGRETRRGLDRLFSGATTAAVAARARCDVIVVPSFWLAGNSKGRVVVGIKSRPTHELLSQAFAEAGARGASLTLVTAWELPDPYLDRIEVRTHAEEWRADGQRVLEDLAADWRTAYPEVQVQTTIAHGAAANVLLRAAGESDLLVISRRHHALPPHGHLGGVAHTVLRLSDVPVLVVPYVEDAGATDLDGLALERAGHALK